jgi:hypothetical protein
MKSTLISSIEFGLKQVAKRNLNQAQYDHFVLNITRMKLVHVGSGDQTVYDLITDHATAIADWATGNRFSHLSDAVENEKEKAITSIKNKLGWD